MTVKQEVLVEEVVDLDPAGTEELDDDTIAAYEMLQAAMQKGYYSVYNSSFKYTDGQYSDAEEEYLTEFVNLVFTDPPYNNRRQQNRENSAHDVLSDDDMKLFEESIQEGLERLRTWCYLLIQLPLPLLVSVIGC